jgi:endonuclease YncB( thermonuclease family)
MLVISMSYPKILSAITLAAILGGLYTRHQLAQASDDIVGRASIIDGDTIEIRGQRIRLWGIDAPEGQQRCVRDGKLWRAHADSANALDAYLAGRAIACKQKDMDRYKRMVAICEVDGEDIGRWMVRMGWAFDFTSYSHGHYTKDQTEAKVYSRGLWQGECELPWEWRRNRQGYTTR